MSFYGISYKTDGEIPYRCVTHGIEDQDNDTIPDCLEGKFRISFDRSSFLTYNSLNTDNDDDFDYDDRDSDNDCVRDYDEARMSVTDQKDMFTGDDTMWESNRLNLPYPK
jgi:hypothetical protein